MKFILWEKTIVMTKEIPQEMTLIGTSAEDGTLDSPPSTLLLGMDGQDMEHTGQAKQDEGRLGQAKLPQASPLRDHALDEEADQPAEGSQGKVRRIGS